MINPSEIWTRFTAPTEVLSVEHCFGVSGTNLYGLELTKTKKEIERGVFIEAQNSETLKKQYDKDLPIVLRLTGRKVLSKKVAFKANEDTTATAQRAFSNLDLSSLYYEQVIIGDSVVVSAIRTDALEEILTEYAAAKLTVVGLNLGVYALLPLMERLQIKELSIGHYDLALETVEAKMREVVSDVPVTIDTETLKAIEVLSYLSGIAYLTFQDIESHQLHEQVNAEMSDWRFKRAYKRVLPIAAISVLGFLLISFLVFNQYYAKNQRLQTETAGAIGAANALNVLEAQVTAKEAFLKNNAGGGRKLSAYCDQIGASLPTAIALEQMQVFPLLKALKREQLFEFAKGGLELKGECSHYADFQIWMETLNDLAFVEKIEVLGYGETDRNAPEKFHLRLNLSE